MLPILILTLSSVILCLLLIAIPRFFAPRESSPHKKEDYECGVKATEKSSSRISVKFFLTAILFILFDIEIIFLYPFALAYRDFLAMEGAGIILMSMGLFLLVFIFGLWWEIKTKALDWK